MSRYKNICGKFAAATLMFTAISCSDEITITDNGVQSDPNMITLSVLPESAKVASRSSYSDASMINRLYYAIYKKDSEGVYRLSTFYHPEGELYKVMDYSPSDSENFTIKLLPESDPEGQYKIACWAQYSDGNKGNKYYNLSGFPNVVVNYFDDSEKTVLAPNNDESRDAFFGSQEFSTSSTGNVVQVELTRPFAQINIGTSGWDYEGMAYIDPEPMIVKYSKVQISGLATTLDILNNRTTDESPVEVTYDYSVIPSYRNLTSTQLEKVFGVYSKDHANVDADPENNIKENKGIFTTSGAKEEFLLIPLPYPTHKDDWEVRNYDTNPKDGFADYLGWTRYDKYCISSKDHDHLVYNIFTETFKYLSMSYVLAPFHLALDEKGKEYRVGTTVTVTFDCSTGKGAVMNSLFSGKGEDKVFTLNNVPVCSNYRTNIIAADGAGFFMNSNEMNVAIISETFADYYKRLEANVNDWTGGSDGTNGSDLNDEFQRPEDIDSEYGKVPLIMPGFLNPNDSKLVNVEGKSVDFIKYLDNEIIVTVDPRAGFNRYPDVESYFPEPQFSYKFYLGGDSDDFEIDPNNISFTGDGKNYEIKITKAQLEALKDSYTPVITELDEYDTDYTQLTNLKKVEVPALKYYPIELRIKTDFGENGNTKFVSEDFVGTIKYHTSYKFTFSSDSTDEGREIIDCINSKGILGYKDPVTANTAIDNRNFLYDEVNSYFLYNNEYAETLSKHLYVYSRKATEPNDKVFALRDRIRVRGAFNNSNKPGHYILFNMFRDDCKITVKLGRDQGVDNSGWDKNNKKDNLINRSLHINWQQATELSTGDVLAGNTWEGWDPGDPENMSKYIKRVSGDQSSTVFINDESKIMIGMDTKGASGKNVKIYVDGGGHSYYWIILSEPTN